MKDEYALLTPFGVLAVFCAGFVLSGAVYSAMAGLQFVSQLILGVLLLVLARQDAREITRQGVYRRGFIFWSRAAEAASHKDVDA